MDMERSHGEAPAAGFLEEGVRDDPRRNERQEERDGAEQSGLLAGIADLLAVDAGDSGSERAHATRTAVRRGLDRLATGSRTVASSVAAGMGRLQGAIRLGS